MPSPAPFLCRVPLASFCISQEWTCLCGLEVKSSFFSGGLRLPGPRARLRVQLPRSFCVSTMALVLHQRAEEQLGQLDAQQGPTQEGWPRRDAGGRHRKWRAQCKQDVEFRIIFFQFRKSPSAVL